jgi:hypothetical protein
MIAFVSPACIAMQDSVNSVCTFMHKADSRSDYRLPMTKLHHIMRGYLLAVLGTLAVSSH